MMDPTPDPAELARLYQEVRDLRAALEATETARRKAEAERDEARELAKAALAFGWYVDGEPRIGAASRLRQRIANLGKEAGDGARKLAQLRGLIRRQEDER